MTVAALNGGAAARSLRSGLSSEGGAVSSPDLVIDGALVRALLSDQHPDLCRLPLSEASEGWDNVVWRLGDDLAVRLPGRETAAELLANEIEWLPTLADRLPVRVPVAIRSGEPGRGYPWRWAIVPWIEGSTLLQAPTTAVDLEGVARALGAFVAALGREAPPNAPHNPHRGVALIDRSDVTSRHLDMMALGTAGTSSGVDVGQARALWHELVETPPHAGPPSWLHGDLHPGNLIVHGGELAGVIDFGDLTSGDPATDLLIAWALFPPDVRPVFRAAVGAVDDDAWRRGRAWALAHGAACLALGASDLRIVDMGRRTLQAALDSD